MMFCCWLYLVINSCGIISKICFFAVSYKQDTRSMEEIFHSLLPESLYMSHYELHEAFPRYTAEDWRRYLKDNDKFILRETAILTEVNARKGLKSLSEGSLSSADSSAIRQLLERSEQINAQVKDKTAFVTVFLPNPNDTEEQEQSKAQTKDEIDRTNLAKQYERNRKIAQVFYPMPFYKQRLDKGQMMENPDGTVCFPYAETLKELKHLDLVYCKLFNPTNEYNDGVVR